MAADWQISFGDLAEALRPALFTLSALASAWVLYDARRREGFRAFAVAAWTLLTLAFPPIFLPLYLAARLFTKRTGTPPTELAPQADIPEETVQPSEDSDGQEVTARDETGSDIPAATVEAMSNARPERRLALPLAYALTVLALGAAYFYRDYHSFDAHLARAERAKLYKRRERAIAEYRAALARRDDAYTRKLLGLELLQAGRAAEALEELRAAARNGEPDEGLYFHSAAALEAMGRAGEAADDYGRFLRSPSCAAGQAAPPLCEAARSRLDALQRGADGFD